MLTAIYLLLVSGVAAAVEVKDIRNLYEDIVLIGIIVFGIIIIISAEMRNPKTKVNFWYVIFAISSSLMFSFFSVGLYLSYDIEKHVLYGFIGASLLFGKDVTKLLMEKAPEAITEGLLAGLRNFFNGISNFLNKPKNDNNN